MVGGDVEGPVLERYLHDLGYRYFDLGGLALLEIDRILIGEKLRTLFASGFSTKTMSAVESFREKHRNGGGS